MGDIGTSPRGKVIEDQDCVGTRGTRLPSRPAPGKTPVPSPPAQPVPSPEVRDSAVLQRLSITVLLRSWIPKPILAMVSES